MAKQSGRLITTWPMPGGQERLGDARSIEQNEQAHADDQIADHQGRGDQRTQRRGAGQAEAGEP